MPKDVLFKQGKTFPILMGMGTAMVCMAVAWLCHSWGDLAFFLMVYLLGAVLVGWRWGRLAAGAAAIQLEDAGDMENSTAILSRESYMAKVRAAIEALKGSDCMLIARTNADPSSPEEKKDIIDEVFLNINKKLDEEKELNTDTIRICLLTELDKCEPYIAKSWRRFDKKYK